MRKLAPCPNCGSRTLYESKEVSAGGGHAPNFLPGLGTWLAAEKFVVVLCAQCGLARFFAREQALAKLPQSLKWRPATAS